MLVAALALIVGCGCPTPVCEPSVTLRLNLPTTGSGGEAEVVACHLDACATAPLPAAAAAGDSAPLLFEPGPVSGSLHTRADGSLQLVVTFGDEVRDGDRLTLTVRDAAGTEVASLDLTATFPQASMTSGGCVMCHAWQFGDPA